MKLSRISHRALSANVFSPSAMLLCMVLGTTVIAGAQAIEINADHPGGILHPAPGRPSFEVAVIRPSAPASEFKLNGIGIRPGSFEATWTTVRDLIMFAYAVPDEKELTGGPGWMSKEHFDLRAKIDDANLPALKALPFSKLKDEMRLRLQQFLEQRLNLHLVFGRKDLALFQLEVVNGGSKCNKVVASNAAAFDHLPPPPPPADIRPFSASGTEAERDVIHWTSNGLPFPYIVDWISQQPEVSGRTVVDRTGLDGGFACDLTWTRAKADPTDSSFLRALKEQMGLRLRPEHGPVEVVTVQNVERPSAN